MSRQNFSFFFLLLISFPGFVSGQINNSGSLTAYVDSLITQIPDVTPSNLYQTPTVSHRMVWESVVEDLLTGSYSSAHSTAQSIGYDIVHYADTSNGKAYFILRKKGSGANYWGTFILNPAPLRSRLFIQIPHPLFDTKTGNQGIVVFKNTGARAFIVAGAHRCNSTQLSSCDGTTSVCAGSPQPFSSSDQAHTADGTFQRSTALFTASVSEPIVVQLHGFGKGAGDPDLIMGNGTNKPPLGTDHLVLLKNALSVIDPSLTFKTAHIDTAWTELTGTTNTQGRLINGSGDPCGTKASTASGRFLHIEQAYAKLRDTPSNWAKMADALAAAIPADPTAIERHGRSSVSNFHLFNNYPNPFNPSTVIAFTLPVSGHTTLTVYDALGRTAALPVNEVKGPGSFSASFDGSTAASGVYLVRLVQGDNIQWKKIVLMK